MYTSHAVIHSSAQTSARVSRKFSDPRKYGLVIVSSKDRRLTGESDPDSESFAGGLLVYESDSLSGCG